ncbi:hypothetical protein BH23CHL2_BH23CHL2_11010 [soil metagenome]
MSSSGDSNQSNQVDSETAARRRSRLERRIQNLEHDIARASNAARADSRWHQRIDEVNAAIKQAEADARVLAEPGQPREALPLPATPVTDVDVQTDIPATVRFRIGDESFRFSEEIDWTERGEQRSMPGLRRFEGNPDALIPAGVPEDRREALQEHLRHTVAALAVALRDQPEQRAESITLADLASPCPVCGNWRDLRDRCITCQRRDWSAEEVRSQIGRLIEERNHLMDEIAGQREALPILQRQLQDARTELEKYR